MTMHQHIELYQDSLRKPNVPLNPLQILLVSVLILALMIIIYAWGQFQSYQLRQQSESLALIISQQREKVSLLAKQQHSGPDAALVKLVRRLEAEQHHLQALQTVILPVLTANPPELYLRGIARRKPAGLWLDTIFVSSSGSDVALTGKLYSPTFLPQFIEAMALESAFAGIDFHTVWVGQTTNTAQPVEPAYPMGFQLMSGCRNNTCPGIASTTDSENP